MVLLQIILLDLLNILILIYMLLIMNINWYIIELKKKKIEIKNLLFIKYFKVICM